MKKQPEITEATRKDFIYAFCECYKESPIEKITVKEISEKAGYSRVTFYNYFKDPYDLLNQIEEEFISNFTKAIHNNIEKNRFLDNFLYTFDELINQNELYSQILLNNSYNLQFSKRLQDIVIPLALKNFKISQDNKKAIYAFEFYIQGVVSMITSWMKNEKDMSIEELGSIIKGILKDGLLAQLR